MKPKVLVFSGYGLNSEAETKYAFDTAGAVATIVHINDLIENKKRLSDFQILAFPGGFSYGDDTGSGNAYANKLRNHLWPEIISFIRNDKLVIGICNGFQILVNLGLLPAVDKNYGIRQAALIHNNQARLITRWVDLSVENRTPWTAGIKQISMPVAHGEGKFHAGPDIMKKLQSKKMVALRFIRGEICSYADLPANPNGSSDDIAGISDESGRILGLMPHPERAQFFHQLPHWTYLADQYKREGKELPRNGPGHQIFVNAVRYFRN
ncbi:MAG: phosphoribosylformylglycinamidine synthase I, phosphoribosylformylglycinamidine synthase [Candidatus Gottesmanbacteria bacterium GW2011_GWA2_43_14]|uniref:Phosphoribosylformylglycinamidine synthase I, phosphoribosylformylglycinamidine synthase n=1 Tax=Candidatus Gottesmanbacteria bacterium GW2011_GWA2_43_14 TaxID=1618443 RepID=A0A0G1GI73_9BACT|nr:MAG: phosphoribosylformylglycinamidine synthase I, phosphoribosylformylglycinamidine synthase [Candidatus Gottesmanbacteria bacterium GW2011_GWA2_43_14]